MRKAEVVAILKAHRNELRAYGVKSLAVFGSVARDEARSDSDVDLLVEFDRPVGLFAFVRLQNYLTELLGRNVDLVTPDALKQPIRERVMKDMVRAA